MLTRIKVHRNTHPHKHTGMHVHSHKYTRMHTHTHTHTHTHRIASHLLFYTAVLRQKSIERRAGHVIKRSKVKRFPKQLNVKLFALTVSKF